MSFSGEWDQRYREDTHMSVWPWSELVSFVMRYARPRGPGFRVLELGCGAGANIPFFDQLGVSYWAIEGSPFIVERLREKWPVWSDQIVAGDFTIDIPFAGPFDLVVDRGSVPHNPEAAIRRCLGKVRRLLKPDGKYVGITWFSTACSEYGGGTQADDRYTRTGYTDGPFARVGKVHFCDREHLEDLFKEFTFTALEHRVCRRELPEDGHVFAAWNFVAEPRPV